MSPARTLRGALAGITLLAVPVDALAQGCAMCRTVLEGQNDPMVYAINTSILFMMTMPYVIVGTIGGWIYLASRRRQEVDQPVAALHPSVETPKQEGEVL